MQRWPDPPPARIARLALWLRNRLRLWVAELLPGLAVFEDTIGTATTQVLALVSRHHIADRIEERPQTAAELGAELGFQADPLHRLLRAMCTRGYFRFDPRTGRFHNTRLSRMLLSTHHERALDFCDYFGSPGNANAWLSLEEVLRTGEDAFSSVHGMTVWDWFDRHPEEQRRFARAMAGQTAQYAAGVACAYPFHEVVSVCDLGGGQGALISELALRYPHLKLTLYDVPGVLEQAVTFLTGRGVCQRVERMSGNLFRSVPHAYDLYLLKNVLHDWDDEACLAVLENVRHAMLPDSRLVIVEFLVDERPRDALGALSDLQMLVVTKGGRERSLAHFEALLSRAGLVRSRVWHTATMSLVEARIKG